MGGRSGRHVRAPNFGPRSADVPDADAADHAFIALANGGKEEMPLTKTFFSPRFGMVTDRFGVQWMILTASAAVEKGKR